MTAPSRLHAARTARDRAGRTRLTPAEVEADRDDACALLSGRRPIVLAQPAGRVEGRALVRQAQAIRNQAGGR